MATDSLKVYVAGKVSKDSVFGTHYWRDEFIETLANMSGLKLTNLDPTKSEISPPVKETVFACDVFMISKADVVVVYLSNDISVGGSQEILIAKYFAKPVVGLAPFGGKFNGSSKPYYDGVIENYQDPFVFSTCDVVCADVKETAEALVNLALLPIKDISFVGEAAKMFTEKHLPQNGYLKSILVD